MIKKNDIAEFEITGHTFPNFGTAFFMDEEIHIKDTIKGQLVRAKLYKKKKQYEGELLEVLRKAVNEIEPSCGSFGTCGGCVYQHIPYEDELEIKKETTLALFDKISGFDFLGIEGSPEHEFYRNKMEYSFGDAGLDSPLSLGIRKKKSHYEVEYPIECNIADNDFTKILTAVLNFYRSTDERFYHRIKHNGALRHLIIRKGKKTGEIFVNLVTTDMLKTPTDGLVKLLTKLPLEGVIIGIVRTINNSVADAVKCDGFEILYGRDYYFDEIENLRFKISAFSFFQTNTLAAERLYRTVKEFIPSNGGVIFDLFCGTGTIAQLVAGNAERVLGVELVEEAVTAAVENAQLNGIENCRFIAGDATKITATLDEKPRTIILDPPRDGLNPKLIETAAGFGAEKIIYVSCKPTSLARDMNVFINNGYKPEKIKLHDLFPRTPHVETVVLMSKSFK